jgi:hypothetical protein
MFGYEVWYLMRYLHLYNTYVEPEIFILDRIEKAKALAEMKLVHSQVLIRFLSSSKHLLFSPSHHPFPTSAPSSTTPQHSS